MVDAEEATMVENPDEALAKMVLDEELILTIDEELDTATCLTGTTVAFPTAGAGITGIPPIPDALGGPLTKSALLCNIVK